MLGILDRREAPPTLLRRARRDGPLAAALTGWGAWWLLTAASQHPHRSFDRLRKWDTFGFMVPNWRFFAPEPAKHDFHVLHRCLLTDGTTTPWRETTEIMPRCTRHAILFPERRREKALFDVCSELGRLSGDQGVDLLPSVGYEVLRDVVLRKVTEELGPDEAPPEGVQFIVARHPGFDEVEDPDYMFASPFIPYEDPSAGPAHQELPTIAKLEREVAA